MFSSTEFSFVPQKRMALVVGGVLTAAVAFMGVSQAAEVTAKSVVSHYADIAEAVYGDSLVTAKILQTAVDKLVASPSQATLDAAREAWLAARVPYQQSEAYRFGNEIVDEWEGKVNAWPLDEGLIDYVDSSYGSESEDNGLYASNIIANAKLTINGESVDATHITPDLIASVLHEAESIEANVASGYHAIEFLLWGQDLHGTEAGAGERPFTDYSLENCSNGNCARRAEYLQAATQLLVSDLEEMAANWQADGGARASLTAQGAGAVSVIFTGMGSLSYGELAGERMKLGLLLHDPEEEHDCFSDNTHASHFYDALGIQNVYLGEYSRVDGSKLTGHSLYQLVRVKDSAIADELRLALADTQSAMQVLVDQAAAGQAFDQLIAEGNAEGNGYVQAAIDGLVAQTRSIERAAHVLSLDNVDIATSDSLDNVDAVFE